MLNQYLTIIGFIKSTMNTFGIALFQ